MGEGWFHQEAGWRGRGEAFWEDRRRAWNPVEGIEKRCRDGSRQGNQSIRRGRRHPRCDPSGHG